MSIFCSHLETSAAITAVWNLKTQAQKISWAISGKRMAVVSVSQMTSLWVLPHKCTDVDWTLLTLEHKQVFYLHCYRPVRFLVRRLIPVKTGENLPLYIFIALCYRHCLFVDGHTDSHCEMCIVCKSLTFSLFRLWF